MLKCFKIGAAVLSLCIIFSSCSSSRHLKDLVIVEGMGIDKSSKGVNMTLQTLDVGINNGAVTPSGNMTIVTQKDGETITNCINNLTKALSKRIFLGQNKLIIIGKSLAEEGFAKNLDYFMRSAESRPDVAVCISSSSAEDIIKSKESDAAVPSENILYLISNNEKEGLCTLVTSSKLLNAYLDKTSDIYLPVLKKEKGKNVNTDGIALFSTDKLVYITDEEETTGFVIMSDKAQSVSLEAYEKSVGTLGVQLSDIRCRKNATQSDGGVVYSVDVRADMIINEVEKGLSTTVDRDTEEKIKTAAEKRVERLCRLAFDACKSCGSDSLRVGEQLACDDEDAYEIMSDEWHKYFTKARINVSCEVKSKKISDNTQEE